MEKLRNLDNYTKTQKAELELKAQKDLDAANKAVDDAANARRVEETLYKAKIDAEAAGVTNDVSTSKAEVGAEIQKVVDGKAVEAKIIKIIEDTPKKSEAILNRGGKNPEVEAVTTVVEVPNGICVIENVCGTEINDAEVVCSASVVGALSSIMVAFAISSM